MEEALEKILNMIDREAERMVPEDRREFLRQLDEQVYDRYDKVESDDISSDEE